MVTFRTMVRLVGGLLECTICGDVTVTLTNHLQLGHHVISYV